MNTKHLFWEIIGWIFITPVMGTIYTWKAKLHVALKVIITVAIAFLFMMSLTAVSKPVERSVIEQGRFDYAMGILQPKEP